MDKEQKELLVIILTIIILTISISYMSEQLSKNMIIAFIGITIAVFSNIIAKKITAKKFECEITIKPWSIYRYGMRKDAHFKEPLPMSWLPLFFSLISNAKIWWLGITQFEAKSTPERASRRHGRRRFTEMTEWHIGIIAMWGIITNIIIAIIFYIINIDQLAYIAQLNIYYAAWSLLPISNLDGTKVLFASRGWWLILTIITTILTIFAMSI